MAEVKKEKAAAGWGSMPEFNPKVLSRGFHLDIGGLEGMGKSSLALTLARCGKVGYVDVDQSLDRAKRPGKKLNDRVQVLPIRYAMGTNEATIEAECKPAWKKMVRGVAEAVQWADGGMIYDTDTEMWELCRLAEFGTLKPQGRTDRIYGILNAKFRELHRSVNRTAKRNLVTIHQLKPEYKDVTVNGRQDSVKTGRFERAGMKEIGYLCDMAVTVTRKGTDFSVTIDLCKHNPALEGTTLGDDYFDVATLIALATNTEPEDWTK